MKHDFVGIVLGAAYCLWGIRKENKKREKEFGESFARFLKSIETKDEKNQNDWKWSVKEYQQSIDFSIHYHETCMYSGTYRFKERKLSSYFYYHSKINSRIHNIFDNYLIDKIKKHVYGLKEQRDNLSFEKDKEKLLLLEKQLKVIKMRSR